MMKKLLFSFLAIACSTSICFSQTRTLPSINVKTLEGSKFNINQLSNNGDPIVISFWATWCKPCKKELNNIAEVYDDWRDETNVKVVAISIDDSRSSLRVEPYINAMSWEYTVLLDPNGDCKRAMNVNNIPHTFLINGQGKVVWDHNNYSPGDEEELYNELIKLNK